MVKMIDLMKKYDLMVIEFNGVVSVGTTMWPTEAAYAIFDALAAAEDDAPRLSLINHRSEVGLRCWMEYGAFAPPAAYEGKVTLPEELKRVRDVVDQLADIAGLHILNSFAHKAARSKQWSATPPQYAGRPEFGRGIALPNSGFVRAAMSRHGVIDKRKVVVIAYSESFRDAAAEFGVVTYMQDRVNVELELA